MKLRVSVGIALALLTALAAGCGREPVVRYESSAQVAKLDPKFQKAVQAVLDERCGTASDPVLLGSPNTEPSYLRQGAAVYAKYCRQCHGVSGDGKGAAAAYLLPKPRDYRAGIFKFTSTTYGSKPLREDLIRTVRRGVTGTSMPSFRLLPPRDLEAVVDYVLSLTHRGELETQLAEAVEFDGQLDPKAVPSMVETILSKWKAARGSIVYPQTPMPEFNAGHVQAGKTAFLSIGCSKCHGDDGRGQTKENIGVDSWGYPTKAADLTSGMLRGGTEALDIYRHVDAGINGTPMPSFHDTLSKQPATEWNLVAYVLFLANDRRKGAIPEAGILKPLPGVEEKAASAATRSAARSRPAGASADSG